ncbi:peptidase domain-containing ABC transporter [Parafilimonas sp.]|uniref:peptidase domain-containing ABC transporter n=1 Tax=Parafilimonas sp. TaxID=1969739 RepID=UPI0039E425A3
MPFQLYHQLNKMDCGPTCLKMVAKHYGKKISLQTLRNESQYSKEGVSLLGISEAAEKLGFRAQGVKLTYQQLKEEAPKPAILHWDQNHFVVVHPKSFLRGRTLRTHIEIADPAAGIIELSEPEFKTHWLQTNTAEDVMGIALLLEPTPAFYNQEDEQETKVGWNVLLTYLKQNRKFIIQLFLGLLIGSLLQLIFPFLTQSIVDTGINTHNLQFIYIILIAQCMLFISRTVVEFIRSRILLYISTRINISLLSDFWAKLMRLPISFFDTKQTGDILQRINDQRRIESFLTGTALSTMFSFISIIIFSVVLLIYNIAVFFVFAVASILYILWIRFFLRHRRNLDYKRFAVASKENSATMQLIYGMQEIKLNNAETAYRWQWENLQARLFNLSFKSLSLSQWQQAGAVFINEGKNIFITFLVATAVLNGQLTLGAMLAIQYIIGQLNSPVEQLVSFVQQAQDAKISLERLNEIYEVEDEEKPLSFGGLVPTIREGLGVRSNNESGTNLKYISPGYWRSQCGSVMQDGYIFNDSIAKNIAVTGDVINYEKLVRACKTANILEFIESLPLGFNTKIGAEGNGISAGQRQRILIARAVYKEPQFLFFDEATNALDANNEKAIIENLQAFFEGRTVVVVAHRLSTVKHADNIVVLHGR